VLPVQCPASMREVPYGLELVTDFLPLFGFHEGWHHLILQSLYEGLQNFGHKQEDGVLCHSEGKHQLSKVAPFAMCLNVTSFKPGSSGFLKTTQQALCLFQLFSTIFLNPLSP